MRDKIRIELSSESRLGWEPFYAVLDLPATAQQIRDAMQKARITGREEMTYQEISFLGFDPLPDLEHLRLDTTTVEELNYLAQRLDALSDEQFIIYQALFDQRFGDVDSDELLSVKDLINMTYGLDSVMVASNIHNDEQLGQFVIENDLHPDVAAIPDNSLYLLDKRRIGELQRKNEGGVLWGGFYVVAGDYEIPEVYDGQNIPAAADDGVFRLKVGLADLNDPEAAEAGALWLSLPIPREEADAIVKDAFGVESIEDCSCFDFESGIPQITAAAVEDLASFDALNAVADRYLTMGTDAQLRFKAILEAENIHDADGALEAADRLNEYELSYFDSDAASFFKTHVCHNLDVRFDDHWLDTLLTQNEGKRLVERLGASITDYADPPYFSTEDMYEVGFGWDDHVRLRETLGRIKGKFLLSYNDCPEIRELYDGFSLFDFSRTHSMAQRYEAGKEFKELLIANYDYYERENAKPKQLTLFDIYGDENYDYEKILKESIISCKIR